jgi:hypothetical protein
LLLHSCPPVGQLGKRFLDDLQSLLSSTNPDKLQSVPQIRCGVTVTIDEGARGHVDELRDFRLCEPPKAHIISPFSYNHCNFLQWFLCALKSTSANNIPYRKCKVKRAN